MHGLERFDLVTAQMNSECCISPFIGAILCNDKQQRVTAKTIAKLNQHDIKRVIIVNRETKMDKIKQDLQKAGITRPALVVGNYKAPRQVQFQKAWQAYNDHGRKRWSGADKVKAGLVLYSQPYRCSQSMRDDRLRV